MPDQPRPRLVLCILDGVGYRTGPDAAYGNAVIGSNPQFYDGLFARYPHTTLHAGGRHVGLPDGQMGNSEVGHLTIGAGRVIPQELVRIGDSIASGEFAKLPAWREFSGRLAAGSGRLHLLGLVSPGGVHSHTDHLYGIVAAARDAGIEEIYVHAFLDGRDTDPRSGRGYVQELQDRLADIGAGAVATVTGRYYAMDRDKRWDRVARAWAALVDGEGARAGDPVAAIARSYAAGVTDEFVEPVVITRDGSDAADAAPLATIRDGDGVFFWNFRADRVRELTWALMQPEFDGFSVKARPDVAYLGLTLYDESLDLPTVYRTELPRHGLAEVFADHGLRNLRTAETEKYAHVTYFFNGGREKPFAGEERKLIPSPAVATYDLQPQMSAPGVARTVREACAAGRYDVIVVNFANGDMVGHTGVYDAAVTAFATLDRLLSEIMPPSLDAGTVWLVTADHGNCDEMLGPDGQVLTQHSLNPVPLVIAGRRFAGRQECIVPGEHGLADIAPTILKILGLPQPAAMTGHSVIA
jgi:2,3-bisphosphoglycerate-independent phosphoglycerate mutase